MYQKTMQTYYISVTFHSQILYQIYTYVKNKDWTHSGKVAGTLLYVKTDETLLPNHILSIKLLENYNVNNFLDFIHFIINLS